ncbi:heparin lyase I family protein [Pollutibacter soli]|uniref:heparin lyase I family protein n=1 Tax=Pollutibacter soli TaxID=3034157 RepID=UPI003013EDF4
MKQFLLLLFCCTTIGAVAQKQFIIYDDCEKAPAIEWAGPINKWQYFQGNVKPDGTGPLNSGTSKIVISDSFSRKGKYSYRFSISKDTSYGKTGLTGTSRAELTWNLLSNNVKTGIRWMAASIMVPTWFQDDVTPDGVLFSTIPVPYDHPTPSFMYIMKGRWFLEGSIVSDSGKVSRNFLYDLGPVDKGVWTDWVMNRNFTQADSGYIRLYKNGKLVLNHTGGNWVEKGHYAEGYVTVGMHKWPWNDSLGEGRGPSLVNNSRTIYLDEIRFGNTSSKLEDFIVAPDSSKNKPPVISAGPDISVNLPKNSVTLRGSASDSDGAIIRKEWMLIAGDTSVKIANATELSTTILNLKIGTYKFRFTVTDNTGFVSNDDINVTVLDTLPDYMPGVFLYDDCEDEPEIQPHTEWAQFPLSRWGFYTGHGNDVFNKADLANITVSSDFARKGKKSYKVSVTKNPTYNPVSMRAELSWNQPAEKFIGINWMSASMLIPKTWVDDCTPVSVLFNTKSSPDDYSTPFRLQILKDRMYAVVVNISSDGKPKGELTSDIGPVVKGQWVDWALHRNFTNQDSGYIKLYRNGVLVWERFGPNWVLGPGRAPEAYIHQGLYKWPWIDSTGMGWGYPCFNGTIEAYYDEFKFGGYNANIKDFVTLDSTSNPKPPATSSEGDLVYFDKIKGQLTQSPMGIWKSNGAGTIAMSSKQMLVGNGWVEMTIPDSLGTSGVLILDSDTALYEIPNNDSISKINNFIYLGRLESRYFVGDVIGGKQVFKKLDTVVVEKSLIRIKRVGSAFVLQTYYPAAGWTTIYTYEYRDQRPMSIKGEFDEGTKIVYPVLGK